MSAQCSMRLITPACLPGAGFIPGSSPTGTVFYSPCLRRPSQPLYHQIHPVAQAVSASRQGNVINFNSASVHPSQTPILRPRYNSACYIPLTGNRERGPAAETIFRSLPPFCTCVQLAFFNPQVRSPSHQSWAMSCWCIGAPVSSA